MPITMPATNAARAIPASGDRLSSGAGAGVDTAEGRGRGQQDEELAFRVKTNTGARFAQVADDRDFAGARIDGHERARPRRREARRDAVPDARLGMDRDPRQPDRS